MASDGIMVSVMRWVVIVFAGTDCWAVVVGSGQECSVSDSLSLTSLSFLLALWMSSRGMLVLCLYESRLSIHKLKRPVARYTVRPNFREEDVVFGFLYLDTKGQLG